MAYSGATFGPARDGYKDGKEFSGFVTQRRQAFGGKNASFGQKLQPVARLFQFL